MLKKSRLSKLLGSIASVVLCATMLTSNVSALETNSDLNPISGHIGNTIDISQLTGSGNQNNVAGDIASLSIDNTEDILLEAETLDVTTSENESTASTFAITPRASAIPLSTLGITNIWVGNSGYDPNGSAGWTSVYSSSTPSSSITKTINTTGYTYIRFRVYQWGYTNSKYIRLDNASPTGSHSMASLNSSGNISSSGDVVYGFIDDYIFSIPTGKSTSLAQFIGYYNQSSPQITKTAKVNITWTTTAPAPTTPVVTYNANSEYAYVNGVDTTMEYRARFDNGDGTYSYSTWTAFTGTALYFPIFDYSYTLQIRYKSSTNGNPSLKCEVPVLARADAPSSYVEYDSIGEILAIYASGKQIEVALGDGSSYISVSPAYYTIGSFINAIPSGGFNRVYVRYAATANEPASKSVTVTLYARNPNTPDTVCYENGIINNLTSDMIFRFNGGSWYSTSYSSVNVTAFMSSTDTTLLEIKYAPTATSSCSAIREITLPILA